MLQQKSVKKKLRSDKGRGTKEVRGKPVYRNTGNQRKHPNRGSEWGGSSQIW